MAILIQKTVLGVDLGTFRLGAAAVGPRTSDKLMLSGKKSRAQEIFYEALEIAAKKAFEEECRIYEATALVDIPVNETIPVDATVPVQLDVPIRIDVSETELAVLTASLASGLESFRDVLSGFGG